jgi:hypothetical protein
MLAARRCTAPRVSHIPVARHTAGTVVKKAPLLCTVDDADVVHYLSIEWTGAN